MRTCFVHLFRCLEICYYTSSEINKKDQCHFMFSWVIIHLNKAEKVVQKVCLHIILEAWTYQKYSYLCPYQLVLLKAHWSVPGIDKAVLAESQVLGVFCHFHCVCCDLLLALFLLDIYRFVWDNGDLPGSHLNEVKVKLHMSVSYLLDFWTNIWILFI